MKILSKKKQKQVCQRIVANAIIAFDLLDVDNLPADKLIRYTKAILENTCNAVGDVGGIKAMYAASEAMARYHKPYPEKKEEKQ